MLLFVAFAYGQKAKFGVRLGVSFPKIIGDDVKNDSNDYTPRLGGGIYVNSKVGEYFWIKHEINYSNRGFNSEGPKGRTLRTNQHYIDIYPLNLAFHIKGFQIFAGPSVSLLVVKTYERINSSGNVVVEKSDLEQEGRNMAEIGAVAGVEYEFPFGLNVGARYLRGFTSLVAPVKNQPKVEAYSQALFVTLGYTINANKKPASSVNIE